MKSPYELVKTLPGTSAKAQESMCVCTISSGSRSLTKFKVDEDSSQIKILDIYVRCL